MQPSLAYLSRRRFLASGAALAAAAPLAGADEPTRSAETLAQALHATLTPAQREVVCFPWDYVHPKFGLLRTRVGCIRCICSWLSRMQHDQAQHDDMLVDI